MNLSQLNKYWIRYQANNRFADGTLLDEVRYDAAAGVEASFDLLEMLQGRYILHLSRDFHLYREEYIQFILDHEFTHLYDFLTYPFPKPSMADLTERALREENINTASDRNIFGKYGEINLPEKASGDNPFSSDTGKKLFDYMNTYSEFHACRVSLGHILNIRKHGSRVDVDVEQNIVPAPYRDISIRNMLSVCLRRAHLSYRQFSVMMIPQIFVIFFRQMMYLMGYLSHFGNARDMLSSSLEILGLEGQKEEYFRLFDALKEANHEGILSITNSIYNKSYLVFVKSYIRNHYNPDLYTEEELEQITPDNYSEFVETLANRQGGRLWSGRVSPVFGVNNINRAYDGVDPETIRQLVRAARPREK